MDIDTKHDNGDVQLLEQQLLQETVQRDVYVDEEKAENEVKIQHVPIHQTNSLDHVSFRLLSEQDVKKLSVVQILYQKPFVHGKIKEHGLHDLRMGATTQFDPCQTCHENIETCNGHFGHITLTYPIYHALCFKNLIKILNCVCFSCFNLVIDIDQTSIMAQELKTKTKSNRKMRKDQFEDLDTLGGHLDTTLDFLYLQSKHKSKCEQCGFPKHKIDQRKLDLKIVWKQPTKSTNAREPKNIFTKADDQTYATLLTTHFDAAFILFCLRQLPKNLREWVLGPLDASCFVLMNILVPPSITRPYTSQGKSMGLNELTSKLDEIVGANVSLFNQTKPVWYQFVQKILAIDFDCTRFPPDWVFFETWCEYNQISGAVMHSLLQYCVDLEEWKRKSRSQCMREYTFYWMGLRTRIVTQKWLEQYASLKYHGSVFLDNGLRLHKPEKKTVRTNAFAKGIVQRVKGKYGRFRWNLLGRRVNQCARSVIVPEAYLDIDELALPMFIAKQLTVPETVQAYNRAKLQQLIIRGATEWPGCNSLVKSEYIDSSSHTDGTHSIELEVLSRVEREALARELQFGDRVMRHLQDGDICLFNRQPSLHRPSVMGHRVRILGDDKGIGLHECVTHPYNADFDGDEMNVHQIQSLEARAEVKEFIMVDKQYANHQNIGVIFGMKQNPLLVLSQLSSLDVWLEKDEMMQYAMLFNLTEIPDPAICCPTPRWTGRQLVCMALPEEFEYERNDVSIRGREWLPGGILDKKHLGSGQGQFFHTLLHQMGSTTLKRVFSDLHRLGSEWLLHNGFSVGISDCVNAVSSATQKRQQMLDLVDGALAKHEKKTTEAKTNHFLNTLLSFTQPSTKPENRLLAMVSCGSKGNANNLTQIMCMLGQQTIDGKRIQKPFHPILKSERTARQSGLITHSYFEGLETSEFYMHCAAGRRGLVDTAVNTASTGYSQRRIIKILESIFLTTDGFVRTTDQQIVNVSYGICNLDVSALHAYKLKTRLELVPSLWSTLNPSEELCNLNDALMQQTFFGQNIIRSHSRHVHETKIAKTDTVIEIPFQIEYVWNRFLKEHPYDPNPQEINLEQTFHTWDHRYFVLKVLLADWFGQEMPYRDDFIEYAKQLYEQGLVPSGEAVGALASESIGEPSTQTTLNTFHYTGILQQNVTNGIPRLRELCSVQKQIKTPLIFGYLLRSSQERPVYEHWCETLVQRPMQYFIRNVQLVANSIPHGTPQRNSSGISSSVRIEFHHERMRYHQLSPFSFARLLRVYMKEVCIKVTADKDSKETKDSTKDSKEVKESGKESKDKKKRIPVQFKMNFQYNRPANGTVETRLTLCVQWHPFTPETIQFVLQSMRTKWIMSGIRGVDVAHVYRNEECRNEVGQVSPNGLDYLVSIMGTNDMTLRDIWSVYPIDYRRTFSNNITEIEAVLGIDASKYVLFKEMKAALSLDGSVVHDNHIRLLVDVMTCTGKLLATDRNGLQEFAPDNILTRASFEKNIDVLRQASINYREQSLNGVSEAIMVGSDLSLGTGASKMMEATEVTEQAPVTNTVFVTTSDWNDFSEGPQHHATQHEEDWIPYMELMERVRTKCITMCLQYITSQPHRHYSRRPAPLGNTETYLARKRKQNDIVHHYRPSSPILLSDPRLVTDEKSNGMVSNEEEDESSTNANNESNKEDSAPSALTTESLSELMNSVAALQRSSTTEALGLMQTLLTDSLTLAFSSGGDSDTSTSS